MPFTFSQFEGRVASLIQDSVPVLVQSDRDALIKQALMQRYSQDRPRIMVSDQAGTASNDLTLPVDAASPAVAVWEDGFSIIKQIEYPEGQVPENILFNDEWTIYRTPTGQVVRLWNYTPQATETVRITWTARHAGDGSTVYAQDFEAVCDLAASLCCEALAVYYAQTRDATISADAVNYRTKSQEYLALGKALRQRYFRFMGVLEDAQGNAPGSGPAISIGDMNNVMGSGVDRVTHPKTTR